MPPCASARHCFRKRESTARNRSAGEHVTTRWQVHDQSLVFPRGSTLPWTRTWTPPADECVQGNACTVRTCHARRYAWKALDNGLLRSTVPFGSVNASRFMSSSPPIDPSSKIRRTYGWLVEHIGRPDFLENGANLPMSFAAFARYLADIRDCSGLGFPSLVAW